MKLPHDIAATENEFREKAEDADIDEKEVESMQGDSEDLEDDNENDNG